MESGGLTGVKQTSGSNSSPVYDFAFTLSTVVACVMFFPIALVSVLFIFKIQLSPPLFMLGIIFGLVAAFFLSPDWKKYALAVALVVALCVPFGLFLTTTLNLDYDSMSYHTPAIYDLGHGYNPVYESHKIPWVHHYPKGIWLLHAGFFQLFGEMSVSSVVNLLGMLLALGCSLAVVSKVPKLSKWISVALVVFSTLAPVPVLELTSHMVDGVFGSLAIAAIWISIGYMTRLFSIDDKKIGILFGMLLLLLSQCKFTGFAFSCVLLAVVLVYLLIFKVPAKDFKTYALFCCSLLVLLSVISYSPYIKNLIYHQNPLYPILSKDIYSFEDPPTKRLRPSGYKHVNPVSGLLMSISEPAISHAQNRKYSPKFPLIISYNEIDELISTTPPWGPPARGGNGPYFFLSFIFGIVGFVIYLTSGVTKEKKLVSVCIVGGFIICSLAMIETWWTRLVPFFSLFPVILLFIIASTKKSSVLKIMSAVLALALLVNTIILCYSAGAIMMSSQDKRKEYESYFSKMQPSYYRFDVAGVPFTERGLKIVFRAFAPRIKELSRIEPSAVITFSEQTKGDKILRVCFEDDPKVDELTVQNTWEHMPGMQAFFIKRPD